MQAPNRAEGRVVHIWDGRDALDRIPLGGLRTVDGLTNKDFLQMLSILLVTSSDVTVVHDGGEVVTENDTALKTGDYAVYAESIALADDVVLTRAMSITTGTRIAEFKAAVRQRDGRCVISGVPCIRSFRGFEAAHVFPLAYEQQWTDGGFARHITMVPSRGGTINSVQNGILMSSSMHQLFDFYELSINPDNGHKIVVFEDDVFRVTGRSLDRRFLHDPARPPDALLRWHFRQAVLTNMRGAGAPVLEHDFPPGEDMMGSILESSMAAERMEFELFARFAATEQRSEEDEQRSEEESDQSSEGDC